MRMSVACPQQKLHFDRTLYGEGPGRARGPKFCMQKKIGTGVYADLSTHVQGVCIMQCVHVCICTQNNTCARRNSPDLECLEIHVHMLTSS